MCTSTCPGAFASAGANVRGADHFSPAPVETGADAIVYCQDVNAPPGALLDVRVEVAAAGIEAPVLLAVTKADEARPGALAALRARGEVAGRRLAVAGSIVVVVAGSVWFVERLLFS